MSTIETTTVPKAPEFRLSFGPLAFAHCFIGKEDPRRYLRGVTVTPCEAGGVILSASDGHCLGVAHDPHGHASRQFIFAPDAEIIKTALAYMREPPIIKDEQTLAMGVMSDGIRAKCVYAGDELYVTPLPRVADAFGTPHWEIDEKPANGTRVVPYSMFKAEFSKLRECDSRLEQTVNKAFQMIAENKRAPMPLHYSQESPIASCLVRPVFQTLFEAFVVLMPIVAGKVSGAAPTWLPAPTQEAKA